MKYILLRAHWYDYEFLSGISFVRSFDSWDDANKHKQELEEDKKRKQEEIINHAIDFVEKWKIESPDEFNKYFANQRLNVRDMASLLAQRCRVDNDKYFERRNWGMTVDKFKNPHDFDSTFDWLDLHIVEIPE